ncbi:hypothetical protein CDD82_1343 [Ophiocordyceps australis]|uniref:Uncharacterized protein n=1 Tax=Ophiocordyceps australis TaxID=1399860 RepID=A0A2C5Y6A5_9HYPO|nr:hypothetical protein CDD82_1343 [Ophiocordyceps australis]
MASQHDKSQQQSDSFKDQLDRAAVESRESQAQKPNPVVEKIAEYVPAASKVLGSSDQQQSERPLSQSDVPGPPNRPTHDPNIEEFVRDQHRSKMPGAKHG